MPELFSVRVVAVASVTPEMLPVPAVLTVSARVPAAAVIVATPPACVFKFSVSMALPVSVCAPLTLVRVMVLRVLPVEAAVVEVSVIAAVVKVTPVETTDTLVADANVTSTAAVEPTPASVQFSDLTPVPKVVSVTVTALVPAVPELETFTVSKPAIVTDGCSAKARAVVDTRFNVSVPEPPLILSKLVKVPLAELNVSLPAVLVVPASPLSEPEVSTPVVSGQVDVNAK